MKIHISDEVGDNEMFDNKRDGGPSQEAQTITLEGRSRPVTFLSEILLKVWTIQWSYLALMGEQVRYE